MGVLQNEKFCNTPSLYVCKKMSAMYIGNIRCFAIQDLGAMRSKNFIGKFSQK